MRQMEVVRQCLLDEPGADDRTALPSLSTTRMRKICSSRRTSSVAGSMTRILCRPSQLLVVLPDTRNDLMDVSRLFERPRHAYKTCRLVWTRGKDEYVDLWPAPCTARSK